MQADIGIVGGGPVGAALAAALAASRWQVALIEPHRPACAPGWDIRMYAISPRNRRLLERVGAWGRMDPARICAVRRMLVFGDAGARLEFSAHDVGVPELASILEGSAITGALWEALEVDARVALLSPARPVGLAFGAAEVTLRLEDGGSLAARLVVGADGARSWVRESAGLRPQPHPDRQMGVVANFRCTQPHGNTAFQWFRNDGVLAWLPLPGERMSMVWSVSEARAAELLALDEAALCAAVGEAGGHLLGDLQLLGPAAAFPIARFSLDRTIAGRLALVGDAAHVVHPLAGQGMNLGLGDAESLAAILTAAGVRDPGDRLVLRRYERSRKEAVLGMRMTTDGLDRLFHAAPPGARWLRNTGLDLVNSATFIKSALVRHALG